jgi:hypothetical protein
MDGDRPALQDVVGDHLEADVIEIRMRATRRLDQMRLAQKETVGLNTGATGIGASVRVSGKTGSTDRNDEQRGRR